MLRRLDELIIITLALTFIGTWERIAQSFFVSLFHCFIFWSVSYYCLFPFHYAWLFDIPFRLGLLFALPSPYTWSIHDHVPCSSRSIIIDHFHDPKAPFIAYTFENPRFNQFHCSWQPGEGCSKYSHLLEVPGDKVLYLIIHLSISFWQVVLLIFI